MDTASLIDVVTSVDPLSLKPVLFSIEGAISGFFSTVTGSINGGADASAGIAEFIQSGLASVGGE